MNAIHHRRRTSALAIAGLCLSVVGTGLCAAVLVILTAGDLPANQCGAPAASGQLALGPPGTGEIVGATEYGGPGDPSSGTVGASGVSLLSHPNSYAELGGDTFQTATAMGGLPYMTPLRVTWGRHSAIAYKRDFGFGGGPIDGLPRVIDLWWQFAAGLGIPYEDGMWSGPVRLGRPPPTDAANLLGQSTEVSGGASSAGSEDPAACAIGAPTGAPLTSGERARLLPSGLAAAPADAPPAVTGLIAAGNQIVGKPYLYGGAHGVPLSEIAPAYDCSSSVEHLLYGGGLLPVTFDAPSGSLETFGEPGAGKWITLYANPDHVFMYVAGLRWDTHNAAGPADGSSGIGWHPLIRSSAGFVARHPIGL
jgi:hypothetical protein